MKSIQKSNPDVNRKIYEAVDSVFILWGKYGEHCLDKAVLETSKKCNIDKKILIQEVNKINKTLNDYNKKVKK